MITTLTLEGFADLGGLRKIGAGAAVGLVLWILVWHRNGGRVHVPAGFRKGWVRAVLLVGALAVVALVVTVVAFDRPTPRTAVVTMAVLAALIAVALTGRRPAGAAAAAVTGGLLGLCLGIAVL